ncbi:hypothetical protein, partial [Coleofasciculus sp.]|uniref:hypothetical protein n=1 Tax=Coleofasciculus sp. TaxID=3100458 RepID=UPI003A23D104
IRVQRFGGKIRHCCSKFFINHECVTDEFTDNQSARSDKTVWLKEIISDHKQFSAGKGGRPRFKI